MQSKHIHEIVCTGHQEPVACSKSNTFVEKHESENRTWYTGMCIDLLTYIASDLNFTYVITQQPDKVWGQRLPNGTWIGMTGTLVRKEADFALSGFSVTPERSTVSDYSKGFYYDEIVLVVRRPVVEVDFAFLVRPFHWLVYAVIGVCLLVVTALFVCVELYNNRRQDDQVAGTSGLPHNTASFVIRTLQTFYGSLLGRSVEYEVASYAGYVLLSAWLMTSLITVATYTSKLTSFSVLKQEELPFRTLAELLRRDDYKWGMHGGGTMLLSLFQFAEVQDTQNRMQRHSDEDAELSRDTRACCGYCRNPDMDRLECCCWSIVTTPHP